MPKSTLIFYYFCDHMKISLSEELTTVFSYTKEEAIRTGSYEIEIPHFLLGLLRHASNSPCSILHESGIDLSDLKSYLDSVLLRKEAIPYKDDIRLTLSRDAQSCYNLTLLEAKLDGSAEVTALHLILAISKSLCPVCEEYFSLKGITYDKLVSLIRGRGLLPAQSTDRTEENIPEWTNDISEQLLDLIGTVKRDNIIFS